MSAVPPLAGGPSRALAALAALSLAVASCGSQPAPTGAQATQPVTAPASPRPMLPSKVKLADGSGAVRWSIEPKPDGAKLLDAQDREVARYVWSASGRIKARDAADETLGSIALRPGKLTIDDPDKRARFALQRQDDGDWKLEDAGDAKLMVIKRRDYGWKVVDAAETLVAKARMRGDEATLEDPAKDTVVASDDGLEPLELACFALDPLEPWQRAGLVLALRAAAAGGAP